MEHDLKPAIDLLNRHVPEWYNKIDVELLNITSMQREDVTRWLTKVF